MYDPILVSHIKPAPGRRLLSSKNLTPPGLLEIAFDVAECPRDCSGVPMSTPPRGETPQATCSGRGTQMRVPSASRVATMPAYCGDCAEPSATAPALRLPVLQC